MKIFAGWKFQRRNPSSAPASAKHSTAMSGWLTWVVRLMIPSVTEAMSATPVLRPSSPSIQLMLLIIPTIQNTVKPIENGALNRITPSPNGLFTTVMPIPKATANRASPTWPEQLPASPQVVQVVQDADDGRRRSADEQRDEVRAFDVERRRDPVARLVEQGEGDGDDEERRGDRDTTRARDRAAC